MNSHGFQWQGTGPLVEHDCTTGRRELRRNRRRWGDERGRGTRCHGPWGLSHQLLTLAIAELASIPRDPHSLQQLCHFGLPLSPSQEELHKSTLLTSDLFFHCGDVTSHMLGLERPSRWKETSRPILLTALRTLPAPANPERAAGAGSLHSYTWVTKHGWAHGRAQCPQLASREQDGAHPPPQFMVQMRKEYAADPSINTEVLPLMSSHFLIKPLAFLS